MQAGCGASIHPPRSWFGHVAGSGFYNLERQTIFSLGHGLAAS